MLGAKGHKMAAALPQVGARLFDERQEVLFCLFWQEGGAGWGGCYQSPRYHFTCTCHLSTLMQLNVLCVIVMGGTLHERAYIL